MIARLSLLLAVAGVLIAARGWGAKAPEPPHVMPWGDPTRGVAIAVWTDRQQYELWRTPQVFVSLKNVTDRPIYLADALTPPELTYRVVVYRSDGAPLPKRPEAAALEAGQARPGTGDMGGPGAAWPPPDDTPKGFPDPVSVGTKRLAPGGAPPYQVSVLNLQHWYTITEPGTYFVLVMRRIGSSWKDGFAVSNLAAIKIVR